MGTRELQMVTEGWVKVTVRGEDSVLAPGKSAAFSCVIVRGYRNASATPPGFVLTVFEPASDPEARR